MVSVETAAIAIGVGVLVPLALSRYVANANWIAIFLAYSGWFVLLYRIIGGDWSFRDEEVSWALGFAMFSNWLAVPSLALVFHHAYRLFSR